MVATEISAAPMASIPSNGHSAADVPAAAADPITAEALEALHGLAAEWGDVGHPAADVPAADPITAEALEALHGLAAEWGDVPDCRALEAVPVRGATTNQIFHVKWRASGGEGGRSALLRVYGEGTGVFFDRQVEISTFEAMSRHGHGPRLLASFPNGRVEQFLHARTLSSSDLRDPEISAAIAAKLREFHKIDMPGPKKAFLWDRLRNWLKVAKSVCSSDEADDLRLDKIGDEISSLENEMSGGDPIVFCHNDLGHANIMMSDETRSVTLIDYEYATFNPVAYDFAHYFCEMATDTLSETPHIVDYRKYPGVDERRRFVHAYLSSAGGAPTETEVENLIQRADKFVFANHLYLALWGIISEHVSPCGEFDFMAFARQRLQQYWLARKYKPNGGVLVLC